MAETEFPEDSWPSWHSLLIEDKEPSSPRALPSTRSNHSHTQSTHGAQTALFLTDLMAQLVSGVSAVP